MTWLAEKLSPFPFQPPILTFGNYQVEARRKWFSSIRSGSTVCTPLGCISGIHLCPIVGLIRKSWDQLDIFENIHIRRLFIPGRQFARAAQYDCHISLIREKAIRLPSALIGKWKRFKSFVLCWFLGVTFRRSENKTSSDWDGWRLLKKTIWILI